MNRILSKNQNVENSTTKRHRKEKRFKFCALSRDNCYIILDNITIFKRYKGLSGFTKTTIQIPIYFNEEIIDPENTRDIAVIKKLALEKFLNKAFYKNSQKQKILENV